MEDLTIRNAVTEDAEALLQIYAPYVCETAISLEYEAQSLKEFSDRIKNISSRFPYLVLCKNDIPIGYAYASTFHARAAYDRSVELSIYIKSDCRGNGYGKVLYQKLEEELKNRGFAVMYACITASSRNPDKYLTSASILFHEKLGFENAGYFKNCAQKFGLWYNMVYMQKNLLEEYKDEGDSSASQEVIDLYDSQKHITGKTAARNANVTKSLPYRCVAHVCIFNSKMQLLIQQRSGNKQSAPLMWDFSASGQVDAGENSMQGAMREAKEELGINLSITEAPAFTKLFFNGFNDYYIVRKDFDLSSLKLQKSEVAAVKWASREEVLSLYMENKFLPYAKSLIELIFDIGEYKDEKK